MRSRVSEAKYDRLSVRSDLSAEFLAGAWVHHTQRTRQILEAGDVEKALNAASAIGDDRLQREASGTGASDAFPHGTSAQRVRRLRKGFETGDMTLGGTFGAGARPDVRRYHP